MAGGTRQPHHTKYFEAELPFAGALLFIRLATSAMEVKQDLNQGRETAPDASPARSDFTVLANGRSQPDCRALREILKG
jgi:hypothetical protein